MSEAKKEEVNEKDREQKKKARDSRCDKTRFDDCEKDAQRKKKERYNRSDETSYDEHEKDVERKKDERSRRTVEKMEKDRLIDKERKSEIRANLENDKEEEYAYWDRIRTKRDRDARTEEEKDYDRIIEKHRKREHRNHRNGKEHLFQNLKAKKGMKVLKEEGRLNEFVKRGTRNRSKMSDWEIFLKRGEKHSEKLKEHMPDLVEKLNQKIRDAKEKEREHEQKRQEKRREGEWDYNPEMDSWYWTGENEPYIDSFCYSPPTEEDKKLAREAKAREMESFLQQKKEEQREKRKLKEIERKEAMARPINPLPERELCDYEKLRDRNVKEREEAMAKCKFFDDLHALKNDMVICKVANTNDEIVEQDKERRIETER